MGPWRRLALLLFSLWILVATNPTSTSSRSFRKFLTELDKSHSPTNKVCQDSSSRRLCVSSRRAFPELAATLESFFAPHRIRPSPHLDDIDLHFEAVDYAILTLVRTKSSSPSSQPLHGFIGILGTWLPVPHPARLIGSVDLRHLITFLRQQVASAKQATFAQDLGSFNALRERTLPNRPWEWLIAHFIIVGALWLMFPDRTQNHFTLSWHNVTTRGNWWCMIFFNLSHGGSLLRLCRTIVSVNYIAPVLIMRRILTLSALYGVVLTSLATSTALAMLVLARRHVFTSREAIMRTPIEINGGGASVYALLVAACLSSESHLPFLGGARPFELLMLNVLFDSFFLAGKKRIADYIAHTGAALGSWLFCSINGSFGYG